jgi:hypothetical protein
MNTPPLHHYRFCLPYRAVHIQCIDEKDNEIINANASGFVVKENDELFLYTCWHVVTGFNMHDIKIPINHKIRNALKITLQNHENKQPGVSTIGGNQTVTVPLFIENKGIKTPVWTQEKKDKPHEDLNNINIKVPSWHDVVKIPLPEEVSVSDIQVLNKDDLYMNLPEVGEKIHIVGFPYGYSSLGMDQPTPIVLTRFLAANRVKDQVMYMLLDGPGAPGMSGGPVFVERDNKLDLTGIYTGLLYPDHVIEKNEKSTALGIYCNLALWWKTESVYAIK